ncbi:MAG TPA: hypothetical protein VHO24_03385 [Opitutaceae bacterium]|nr:hypothetical protein [Opitutaceae bacterium]
MSTYVPFLKAKLGEMNAMSALDPHIRAAITPFFDFPRGKPDYTAETYEAAARSIAKGLKAHWGTDRECYFDDFDVGQKFTVKGEPQYAFMLKALRDLKVIPVVGLARTSHNAAVAQLKQSGDLVSDTVAFRVEHDDFEDFKVKAKEIGDELGAIFKKFKTIDLVLDCRLCSGMKAEETAPQIAAFVKQLAQAYNVRHVIVTGSSIPATIRDVVKSKTSEIVPRHELAIITKARKLSAVPITPGDYATVSPFYSDKQFKKEILQKVTVPRLIYSFDHSHYIRRGASLDAGGHDQYFGMTNELLAQKFFRKDYSFGEAYFAEKTKRIGNRANNASVVKPSIVAHITYMVMGAKF